MHAECRPDTHDLRVFWEDVGDSFFHLLSAIEVVRVDDGQLIERGLLAEDQKFLLGPPWWFAR